MKTELKTAIVLGIVVVGVIAGLNVVFFSAEQSFESGVKTEDNVDGETGTSSSVDSIELGAQQQSKILSSDEKAKRFEKAPQLNGATGYLNTQGKQDLEKQLQDKVVLYDIWTYSCINCIRTLSHITSWHEKYSDDGLVIVGVHSPEFEFEKDIENVKKAVKKHDIEYPVVQDNDMRIWRAFDNRYWPHKFIADHDGYLRYDHIGEGAYKETEQVIRQLLKERKMDLGMSPVVNNDTSRQPQEYKIETKTPELYFGYDFARGRTLIGNQEGFRPQQTVQYQLPDDFDKNKFYLEGKWKNHKDSMELVSDTGQIVLPYHAKSVNIVTGTNDASLKVLVDDVPIGKLGYAGEDVESDSTVSVREPRLYNIVSSDKSEPHLLRIKVLDPGFRIFTFTFG